MNYDKAESYFTEALDGQRKLLGDWHENTLTTAANFASLCIDTKKYSKTEELFQLARAGQEKTIGPAHPSTLVTYLNLGRLYRTQGHYGEAEEMIQLAVKGFEGGGGGRFVSQEMFAALRLGEVLMDQRKYEEAAGLLDRAYKGRLALYGNCNEDTLEAAAALADCQNRMRMNEKEKEAKEVKLAYEGFDPKKLQVEVEHESVRECVHNRSDFSNITSRNDDHRRRSSSCMIS
jgi:tetratricopeptide (TPR) repeat protein